ncbi:hypothetical protein D9615_009101 [Tricholomella constricta]|uniref:Transcobalamin-like C-terminal domain-containing protein n=1 Tax=Tricholomella constricta TaxID=117010 RepID=A0A8H5H0P3_9AGAR|nr:hypothetical protein D9615_009101 [Tricholomella constricta]
MFPISLVTLAISFLAPFALAAPTSNVGTAVNLRIEGDTGTIFEGPVFTQGHDVETASGGTHHCDGTNLNANPAPGPTATSALDDAAKLQGFAWDGTYFAEFDDFFITSIAGVTQTQTQFWGYFVNFHLPDVGGCQQQVNLLDEVLFAFDPFGKPALKLSGEHVARVGEPVTLTVTDGQNGDPIAGASVDGQTTDAAGQVSVTFTSAGVKGLKAEKEGTVRSNRLDIVVAPSEFF